MSRWRCCKFRERTCEGCFLMGWRNMIFDMLININRFSRSINAKRSSSSCAFFGFFRRPRSCDLGHDESTEEVIVANR